MTYNLEILFKLIRALIRNFVEMFNLLLVLMRCLIYVFVCLIKCINLLLVLLRSLICVLVFLLKCLIKISSTYYLFYRLSFIMSDHNRNPKKIKTLLSFLRKRMMGYHLIQISIILNVIQEYVI